MLGVAPSRSFTMTANTVCFMWEITQDKGLPLLERYVTIQEHVQKVVIGHLENKVHAEAFSMFQGFEKKMQLLVSLHCERRAYFPGNCIVREGQMGAACTLLMWVWQSWRRRASQSKPIKLASTLGYLSCWESTVHILELLWHCRHAMCLASPEQISNRLWSGTHRLEQSKDFDLRKLQQRKNCERQRCVFHRVN